MTTPEFIRTPSEPDAILEACEQNTRANTAPTARDTPAPENPPAPCAG